MKDNGPWFFRTCERCGRRMNVTGMRRDRTRYDRTHEVRYCFRCGGIKRTRLEDSLETDIAYLAILCGEVTVH